MASQPPFPFEIRSIASPPPPTVRICLSHGSTHAARLRVRPAHRTPIVYEGTNLVPERESLRCKGHLSEERWRYGSNGTRSPPSRVHIRSHIPSTSVLRPQGCILACPRRDQTGRCTARPPVVCCGPGGSRVHAPCPAGKKCGGSLGTHTSPCPLPSCALFLFLLFDVGLDS